jgi:hypothetical protein
LDALNLLRDGTQNTFFQPIELVEASPSSDLTYSEENSSHRFEIESVIATEYQHKSTELTSQSFDGFRFT